MIVLDASATVELLFRSTLGAQVAERIGSPAVSLHAPHLLSVEVTQVLRRLVRREQLSAARAAEAVVDLGDLDIARYEHEPLLVRMWELRPNLTAYDAAYVALAELLDAPLLTTDVRLARSPGARCTFEVLTG